MKATVQGRSYEGRSWAEVLASALLVEQKTRTYTDERRDAAKQLARGVSVVIGGVIIKPEGARE